MKKVYLLRHGETDWNKNFKIQGQLDIELNEKGVKDSIKTAEFISNFNTKIDMVISSPLQRSKFLTKEISKRFKLEPVYFDELKELDFGVWEGLSFDEVRQKYPDDLKKWIYEPQSAKIPEGESLSDLQNRVKKVIGFIKKENKENFVVVGHGVVNRIIILNLLGLPLGKYRVFEQDSCSISIFEFEWEWRSVLINFTLDFTAYHTSFIG